MKTEGAELRKGISSFAISASSAVASFFLQQAESPEQIAAVRELFLEYAQSLNFSLCFQSFEKELAELPGDYSPPRGRLWLAAHDSQLAGCVALHKLEKQTCEMKRLYVRPGFRGRGLGRVLAERVVADAREIGYKRLRLDTVEPVMRDAVALYRKLGFRETAPYRENPIEGALYMELELQGALALGSRLSVIGL
jgi:ribosomal protein S18 acetylase RimI-like enzyme